MPYCCKCGVEVDPNVSHCPLCQTEIQKVEEKEGEFTKKYPDELLPEKKTRTQKQKRFLIWEIMSVSFLIPLLISLFIDLIVNKTVSWSVYSISSLFLVWILITGPLIYPKKLPLLLISSTVPFFIYLLVLDLIDNGQINWYLRLGLPITAVVTLVAISIVVGSILVKNKGVNIISFVLMGTGIGCLGIDFIVTSYIKGTFTVNWSLYVLVSTLLLGGFLLYIHFRLLRNAKLKRKLQM